LMLSGIKPVGLARSVDHLIAGNHWAEKVC
jgi:hypothetical protein